MPTLSPKAVIEGRTGPRPSTAVIIGLVLAGFGALLVMISYFYFNGAAHTVEATVMALPVGLVVIAGLLFLDRFEPEPPLKLLFAFLWGCGVAALIALIVNTLGIEVLSLAVGSNGGSFLGAGFLAPMVEESLKGAVLLILLWRRRDEINGVTDCVLYAGMVAMGFAVIEDVNYFGEALGKPGDTAVVTWVMRTVLGPVGHPAFTSATGLGVAYAATGRRGGKGVLAVIGGWCLAVFLHMSWNIGSSFGIIGMIISLLMILGWLSVLIVQLVRDRRRLIGTIQQYLPLYIPSGVVAGSDIPMLSTLRARRRARNDVRSRYGAQAAKALADYQLAATELALLHASAVSRTVTSQRFTFRQQTLTSLMRQARQAFSPTGGHPGVYTPHVDAPLPALPPHPNPQGFRPGAVQPGAAQPGPAQPGATQPSPAQPGGYQQAPYQQGSYQQGPYQQGPYQQGPYQQGPYQQGRQQQPPQPGQQQQPQPGPYQPEGGQPPNQQPDNPWSSGQNNPSEPPNR